MEGPSDLESGDVVAIDLGERGITHAACVVAIVRPGVTCAIKGSWRGGPAEKSAKRKEQNEGIRRLGSVVHP